MRSRVSSTSTAPRSTAIRRRSAARTWSSRTAPTRPARDREEFAARRLHRLPAVPGESARRAGRPPRRYRDRRGALAAPSSPRMTVVGQRVRAMGWDARTSGTDAYSADLPFTDVLVGRILRSPHPYAEIRRHRHVARRAHARCPRGRHGGRLPEGLRYIHSGGETSDRGPLADGVVRYVGEEVAAVAAETAKSRRRRRWRRSPSLPPEEGAADDRRGARIGRARPSHAKDGRGGTCR